MTRGQAVTLSLFFCVSSLSCLPARTAGEPGAVKRPSRQYTIEQFLATTTVSRPAISPDGSKVLYTSDASGIPNVYTVAIRGGRRLRL